MVSQIIPSLPSLIADAERRTISISDALLSDYRSLLTQYQSFLTRCNLFEPGFARSEPPRFDKRFVVVFPELIDDYLRYADLLPGVGIVDSNLADKLEVHHFSNSILEIEWLAEEISDLLSRVHPGDIVVSVAALEALEPGIREAFRLRSIPIDIRAGRPLSRSPFGLFFVDAGRCVTEGFDLERFHTLLVDPRIPWRNPGLNQELIRFGIEHRCGRNGEADVWYERLTAAGESRLAGYYRSIRDAFTRIVRAVDVSALRKWVITFSNDFLDSRTLVPQALRTFEAVLESLGKLERVESMIGREYLVDDAYALWTTILSDQIYVASSSVPSTAVTFYPYRVAAGINPPYHFIVNASDPGIRVVHDHYSHLPSHAREAGERRDVTDLFLRAYSGSGTRVSISASDLSHSGVQLLPPFLQRKSAGVEIDDSRRGDGFVSEREYWRNGLVPSRLYPVQVHGFSSYLFRRRTGDDYTRGVCEDGELVSELLSTRTNEVDQISISSTALDSWIDCPFAFLTAYLLSAREYAYSVYSLDPLREGALLHELAELLFALGEKPDLSRIEVLLEEIVRDENSRFPQPNSLLLDERISAIRDMLEGLVESKIASEETVATERSYEIQVGNISVNGRVDRVARIGAGLKIVDYKRSRVPTRGGLEPRHEASSYQIPIYALLVGSAIGNVVSGSYYSLRNKKETVVFGDGGWFESGAIEEFMEIAKKRITEMAKGMERGDYRVRKKTGGCDRCMVRSICRKRYVIS